MAMGPTRRGSRWRFFDIGLRVTIPVGFVALTTFNVMSLTSEGPARKPPSTPAVATAAKEVKVATVGEIGSDASGRHTIEAMAAQRPDLYMALGDLGYSGVGAESHWCTTVRDYIGFIAPFELAAGESEEDGSHDGRLNAYAACLPDRLNASGQYGRQYYFDIGNLARVIVISPNLTIDGKTYSYTGGDPDYAWLANAIDGARTAGVEWVMVAMNEDCISAGSYYCNISQDLLSMLVDKRVDLVLSAHDHSYQRSEQLASSTPACPTVVVDSFNPACVASRPRDNRFHRGTGTIFAVAGSGGSNLYALNRRQPDAPYVAAAMGQNDQPSTGFLLLTVSKASISARFVPSNGGRFGDQFSIAASVTPPSKADLAGSSAAGAAAKGATR